MLYWGSTRNNLVEYPVRVYTPLARLFEHRSKRRRTGDTCKENQVSNPTAQERRIANLEKMIEITRAMRSRFNLQELLVEIMDGIVELADCEKSSILLINEQTGELYFASASGTQFDRLKDFVIPRHGSIAGTIAQTKEPIIVDDAQTDPRFFSQVDNTTGQQTKTLMGVPMEIGGRIIGVLEAVNKNNNQTFDQEDEETLLMFAPQAAVAIENTRLLQEQRQRFADGVLIQDAIQTLSGFLQMDRLLSELLTLLEEAVGYTRCAVWLLDEEQEHLRLIAVQGFSNTNPGPIISITDSTIINQVAQQRKLINLQDLNPDQTLRPMAPDTHAVLAVPMLRGEEIVGVINVESTTAGAFNERDERILYNIALQTALGIRQADLYEDSLRANQLKQEFITTMSHELRTPMTVVISSCEMILKKALGPLNEAQSSTLKIAVDRANLLLRLLNDVLDFSKIASGDLKLYPTRVALDHVVQSAIKRCQVYADRKKQAITIEIPEHCQFIKADGKRLTQILVHLIDNAIKFSPDEKPIKIQAHPHTADYICVDVIDQGIGIQPQDTELIFDDFRQLDNSFTRDYGGAGMGLAISKHLVELQGGIIWVESEFGKGSTFSFILPRPEESDDPPP